MQIPSRCTQDQWLSHRTRVSGGLRERERGTEEGIAIISYLMPMKGDSGNGVGKGQCGGVRGEGVEGSR